jgi:hypothetical protein
MADEPGKKDTDKPAGENKPAGQAGPAAAPSAPKPPQARVVYVNPPAAKPAAPAQPAQKQPQPAPEKPAGKAPEQPPQRPPESPVEKPAATAAPKPVEKPAEKPAAATAPKPGEKPAGKPPEKPAGAPPHLVDLEPSAPSGKPAAPKPNQPSLAARSTDRLAMNPPPARRRGGFLSLLLVLVVLAGGGYFLWRAGQLDPLIAWAKPYTDQLQPVIARIEALIPGHQNGPAAETDEATILEIKQLLLKLDFQPGPMNGTLDPATIAAIQAYQDAAGLPVDGQPSQALLEDLRGVANPSAN